MAERGHRDADLDALALRNAQTGVGKGPMVDEAIRLAVEARDRADAAERKLAAVEVGIVQYINLMQRYGQAAQIAVDIQLHRLEALASSAQEPGEGT